MEATRAAMAKRVEQRTKKGQSHSQRVRQEAGKTRQQFVRYTAHEDPAHATMQLLTHGSSSSSSTSSSLLLSEREKEEKEKKDDSRLIKVVDAAVDPLEPPKHVVKETLQVGTVEDQVPVAHSPPRKLSRKEIDAWRIPAALPAYRDRHGHVIPLHLRLAAQGFDGSADEEVGDSLADVLNEAAVRARDELRQRARMREALRQKQLAERDAQVRHAADVARLEAQRDLERLGGAGDATAAAERERRRREALDERERERRMGGGGGASRFDDERLPGASLEPMFDQRLFSQATPGLSSGFHSDEQAVYDRPLLRGTNVSNLFRAPATEEAALSSSPSSRFGRRNQQNDGNASSSSSSSSSLQFEDDKGQSADPFGIQEFISTVRQQTEEDRSKRQRTN
jgi:SNW domain-containing protein 1